MKIQPQDIAPNRRFISNGESLTITVENIDWYAKNPELLEGEPLTIEMMWQDFGCQLNMTYSNTVHVSPHIKITHKLGVFSVYAFQTFLVDIHYVHEFQALMIGLILNIGK